MNTLRTLAIVLLVVGIGVFSYMKYGATQTPDMPQTRDEMHSDVTSEEEAIGRVMSLPEVKEWQGLFDNEDGTSPVTGGVPAFSVDEETADFYTVRVYENMPERTQTFNFYDVSKKGGAVVKEE